MSEAPAHPGLAPLLFLLGRWEGAGVGGYPTIESFQFGQEIIFSHNGKPFLSYLSRTWRLDEDGRIGPPLATESGYWRAAPDNRVEVMLAHPTGIVEIYLGEVSGTKVEMATDVVARTATAKEVSAGRRIYGLAGPDLGWAYDMAAMGQPLQSHMSALLKRVSLDIKDPRATPAPKLQQAKEARGPAGQGRSTRGSDDCQELADRRLTGDLGRREGG